ncbi:MAG: VPLPA-CTERM sorting domain-containing protein [Deltaproteobacteria bacterium]|nr:VPLPA-CTERM sorting domain-containing protein [Deltaproteobacteria bacterium]MBW1925415.1 VPLPA-CTERM sorting domain-containing protein [Deltaproteobacteria bacterium]MBW1950994.1 VPLPA-CTERM sorting domain-containing protein [Deltaproteobacteria bacterium]MBW2009900.1 VPLPA-CTERM sorting domain-containing protein [Deltaproteobacteria bacterium]MBW2349220.1 VPLPA-CTERM sorting domain-containing protein [Deltaproteobacteria bacterium]
MKRTSLLAAVIMLFFLVNVGNTFAFIWYYGDDPNVDYEVVTSPVYDILVPYTVSVVENQYESVGGFGVSILKDGQAPDYTTWKVSLTNQDDLIRVYAPFETATSYPLRLIGLVQDPNDPSSTVLPCGTYEPKIGYYYNTLNGYVSDADGNDIGDDFKWISAQNHFKITVVPIPGAGWLLGSALVGLVGLSKRSKK